MNENAISKDIVECAIEVHQHLGGPGLLENVYQLALAWELRQRGFQVETEKLLPVIYKGHEIGDPYRIDMVVNNLVIVECKATTAYNPVFEAQLLTYLRLSGLKLGLVINFGEKLVKQGLHRVINGLIEPSDR
jgi:GxxExxY protein